MNDYGGLGILIEEKEPYERLAQATKQMVEVSEHSEQNLQYEETRSQSVHELSAVDSMNYYHHHSSEHNETLPESEILLPPLPEDDDISHKSISTFSTTIYSPESADEALHQSHFDSSEMKYELDSPSLNLDAMHLFPSLSSPNQLHSPTSAHANSFSPSLSATTTNTTLRSNSVNSSSFPNLTNLLNTTNANSSPLRRLKSLKNGIRKLSLGSATSTPTSVSTVPSGTTSLNSGSLPAGSSRPSLNPIQTDLKEVNRHSHNSSRSLNSSGGSLTSVTGQTTFNTTTFSTTTFSKPRRNTLLTPLTPPLSSPIVTLSENFSSSKKAMFDIEQTYFECMNMKAMISPTSEKTTFSSDRVSSITEITSSAELINYSAYLTNQKKSVADAFETTTEHLTQSGWCSSHDLNNLQLQQDTQMSQIDTKLLQIEEKLNSDYGISLLNTMTPQSTNTSRRRGLSEDKSIHASPSLKVLESRCYSYSEN